MFPTFGHSTKQQQQQWKGALDRACAIRTNAVCFVFTICFIMPIYELPQITCTHTPAPCSRTIARSLWTMSSICSILQWKNVQCSRFLCRVVLAVTLWTRFNSIYVSNFIAGLRPSEPEKHKPRTIFPMIMGKLGFLFMRHTRANYVQLITWSTF